MTRKEFIELMQKKQYIGDGVYIHFDGYHFILETSDGTHTTNRIGLEPEVITAFLKYRENLYKNHEKIEEPKP